jgi:tRNA (guanine37-N1)-methyltransferase
VMRADVVDSAVAAYVPADDERPLVYLTPRGRPLVQDDVRRYAASEGVVLLCGRFEGVDERVLEARRFEQVSIGDYVLSGGEPAVLVLLDAVIRLLPGVMGSDSSAVEESFSAGLLEYPHYTKPAEWQGRTVPDTLLSGNHAAIAAWRRAASERDTGLRRPDLWERYLSRVPSSALPIPAAPRN